MSDEELDLDTCIERHDIDQFITIVENAVGKTRLCLAFAPKFPAPRIFLKDTLKEFSEAFDPAPLCKTILFPHKNGLLIGTPLDPSEEL